MEILFVRLPPRLRALAVRREATFLLETTLTSGGWADFFWGGRFWSCV